MILVIVDLSGFRRFFVRKYDDFLLSLKLHPINKKIIIAAVVLIILLVGNTVYAAVPDSNYKHVLDYLVNNRHYPREYAEKIIDTLRPSEYQELVNNIHGAEHFDKITNVTRPLTYLILKTIFDLCK